MCLKKIFRRDPANKTVTPALKPITSRELLLASVPLGFVYLIQFTVSKGLSLAGLLGLGVYLGFLIQGLPRLTAKPLTIIRLLIIGGLFALTTSIAVNFAYVLFGPHWSSEAYFILIGLSGMDAPSLLVPLTLLLIRASKSCYVRLRPTSTDRHTLDA